MESRIIYRTFFIIILVQTSYCFTRKLTHKLLKDTDDDFCQKQHYTLLYIKAEGPNDFLHYLWSFMENPSVLVALTLPSSTLEIEWPKINPFLDTTQTHKCMPENISFDNDGSIFTYGLSIQKIYEFNDVNDTGNITACSRGNINVLNPRYFNWYIKNLKILDDLVELEMVGHTYSDPDTNITRSGSITMLVTVFGTLDRFSQKPSMLHSENSTQIDLSIESFETNRTFSNSRFAVEVLFISEGNPDASITVNVKKNMNDQHTPGVFKVMEIKTPPLRNFEWTGDAAMYLQWRPISYTTNIREVTDSINMIYYPLEKSKSKNLDTPHTILYPYYEDKSNDLIMRKLNVSFGINGDDFYKKTRYNSWTLLLGFSNPLDEQISLMIVIISNIVGLPLIAIIFRLTFTWYRKLSTRDNELPILNR